MKDTPATTPKRIFLCLAILLGAVMAHSLCNATVVVYEGFCYSENPESERIGWLTNWRQGDGEVKHIGNDLKYDGLASCAGAIQLNGPKVTVASQLNTPLFGTTYGSARIKTGHIKPDSVIAITFAGPETEDVVPKNSAISLILKAWKQELGTISRKSTKTEFESGSPIQSNSDYLLIWHMEQSKHVTMWILDESQAKHFTQQGFATEQMENARIGAAPDNVMQRISAQLSKKLDIDRGYLLSCFALTCPGTMFDEIRISDSSLAEAVGM